MYRIKMVLHLLLLEYIIVGDFNAEPAELQEAGVLELLQAEVVTPSNPSFTCTTTSCRMMD